MLLKPSYEAPNDSTQDIVERGITPINSNGGFWEDYLLNSVNAWEKLGKHSEMNFFLSLKFCSTNLDFKIKLEYLDLAFIAQK